ncbi:MULTISPECIES: VIT and VWA domain-containing protein [unclassified Pseudovibrio]|uniref:VIT and vWA domain-containing protein n=1 Tax=unclassified Pseudovibrio TaxID=2627060 RepID=UPI0007AE8F2F|nr:MULTISPECIES: VIT and VWA domain-containing protein [unclassified Pseudovibrio]KZK94472.1 Vault protein inter-alpha-trypsin [Pseudovibrio sp. W74]KZL07234.1 Vault protein inter-alpha-trypsin [Pseudovibrio sp. Ad14]
MFETTRFLSLLLIFVVSTSSDAGAEQPDPLGKKAGTIVAMLNGQQVELPLLSAHYDVDVVGDIAQVTLSQTFLNPNDVPLHATYLFPLNQKAAVHAMEMELEGQRIVAQIKEKQEANAVFKQAKAEGKAASLLTQHRPNMFTQDIANLMPGKPVTVHLQYVQSVPKVDGAYELVVPMVVGPRYQGATEPAQQGKPDAMSDSDEVDVVSGWEIDRLSTYPQVLGVSTSTAINHRRVSLDMSMTAALPISGLWSSTHKLSISGDETKKQATFEKAKEVDNKDFVLRYELAAETSVTVGLDSHYEDEKGGFFSLLIEPPKVPAEATIGKRELVFVVDTSGSMGGAPIAASKAFMRAAINNLRPDDYFRILRFANETTAFEEQSLIASEHNKQAGLEYVSSLYAGGGTELNAALNAAFGTQQPKDTTRIVVFLTDGYIGNERKVIQTVANRIGKARLYAFGVGSSVNRFLLEALATEGRGYARYVEADESFHETAEAFAKDLKTPVLTDVSIDWNGLEVEEQSPTKLPDLFEGRALRILGRYQKSGKHTIFISGLVNGKAARMPLEIDLSGRTQQQSSEKKALPIIWAREQIFAKNRAYTIGGSSNQALKNEIIKLGLDHSLQTRFTSFIAVSEGPVNHAPENAVSALVPLPQVSGVTTKAYPNLSGSSAPEPEGIMGLLIVIMGLVARFRQNLVSMVRTIRCSITRTGQGSIPQEGLDRSLPYKLRRDGWWLD